MKKEKYFGYYGKDEELIGVSKSSESQARFLRGARKVGPVIVQGEGDYIKDLRGAYLKGELLGAGKGLIFTAIGIGGICLYRKIKSKIQERKEKKRQ